MLIDKLKLLREKASLTQDEAASLLGVSRYALSRMESYRLPSYSELCGLLGVYGVPVGEWESYLSLWELAERPARVRRHHQAITEGLASYMAEFQPGRVPSLLRTAGYATALYRSTWGTWSLPMVDREVAELLRRQQQLFASPPLTLDAFVNHEALMRVDRAQLVQLLDRAQLPNVVVRVLPETVLAPEPVIFLRMNGPDQARIACQETDAGLVPVFAEGAAAVAKRALDRLYREALSPDESLALLKEATATAT